MSKSSVPQVRFPIGARVWSASTGSVPITGAPCSDCLGQKVWHVTLPTGESFDTKCETCDGRGSQYGCTFIGSVQQLTIGSIRIDTNAEHPVSYMCNETGIGSGQVWYEHQLFDSEVAARTAADQKAAQQQVADNERRTDDLLRRKAQKRGMSIIGHIRSEIVHHEQCLARLRVRLAEKVTPNA